MFSDCLAQSSAGHLPQLNRAITTHADKYISLWGKSQSVHTGCMPCDCLEANGWPRRLHLPQPNSPFQVATGEDTPVWTPSDHSYWERMWQRLLLFPISHVPDSNRCIFAAAG